MTNYPGLIRSGATAAAEDRSDVDEVLASRFIYPYYIHPTRGDFANGRSLCHTRRGIFSGCALSRPIAGDYDERFACKDDPCLHPSFRKAAILRLLQKVGEGRSAHHVCKTARCGMRPMGSGAR